jgi:protein-S-isoprenylcysteine O-methyltransferase Ste14
MGIVPSTAREPRARSWSRYLPLALFITGVVINLAALGVQLGGRQHLLAAGFVAANLAWLLLETPVTFRRASAPPREVKTLAVYGIARFATVGAAVLGPPTWSRAHPLMAVAALLFVAGVLLRLVAMRTLGQFYSHHVIRRDDHVIVQTGPYRVIRHPAYAAMLLGHLGLVLFFLNWASAILLVALAFAVAWRIRVEERELLALPAYRAYAAGRPRLLPGVW